MQPPQPILVVDLFPEILDALLSLLGGLSADAWQRPSACPGWSVKDVALHLLGVEVGNLSRRRDAVLIPRRAGAPLFLAPPAVVVAGAPTVPVWFAQQ